MTENILTYFQKQTEKDCFETFSDVCLFPLRTGLGGKTIVVEDQTFTPTPSSNIIVSLFMTLIAFSVWLPMTLLGIALIGCSNSYAETFQKYIQPPRGSSPQPDPLTPEDPLIISFTDEEVQAFKSLFLEKTEASEADQEVDEEALSAWYKQSLENYPTLTYADLFCELILQEKLTLEEVGLKIHRIVANAQTTYATKINSLTQKSSSNPEDEVEELTGINLDGLTLNVTNNENQQ